MSKSITNVKFNALIELELSGDQSGLTANEIIQKMVWPKKNIFITMSTQPTIVVKTNIPKIRHKVRLENKLYKLINLHHSCYDFIQDIKDKILRPKIDWERPQQIGDKINFNIHILTSSIEMLYEYKKLNLWSGGGQNQIQMKCYNITEFYKKIIQPREDQDISLVTFITDINTKLTQVIIEPVFLDILKFLGHSTPSQCIYNIPAYDTPDFDRELKVMISDIQNTICSIPLGDLKL